MQKAEIIKEITKTLDGICSEQLNKAFVDTMEVLGEEWRTSKTARKLEWWKFESCTTEVLQVFLRKLKEAEMIDFNSGEEEEEEEIKRYALFDKKTENLVERIGICDNKEEAESYYTTEELKDNYVAEYMEQEEDNFLHFGEEGSRYY